MTKKKEAAEQKHSTTAARFSVGSQVRVKQDVSDPDFPEFHLGGWTGTIKEITQDQDQPVYLIEWNRRTLEHIRPVFRKRCERDGLDYGSMWLDEESLELDRGEPVSFDQLTNIIPRPLSMDDQDDRVCAAFGLPCLPSRQL